MGDSPTTESTELDPRFQQEILNLYRHTVYWRWVFVALLCLTVGSYSLWCLRYAIALMLEHFTWAALREGLRSDLLAALGVFTCIGTITGVLIGQTCHSIWGLSKAEYHRLAQYVTKIRQQGPSHPLWHKIIIDSEH
jgi:hypothetical protein